MPEAVIEIVTPGSADDPFAPKNVVPSPPAVDPTAAPVVSAPSGEVPPTPAITTPAPAGTTPAPTATPAAPPTVAPGLDADAVQKMIDDRLRDQQSGYDRRINVLSTQLTAERENAANAAKAHEEQVRNMKLQDSTLTAEEKQRLQQEWNIADEKAQLAGWQSELETFHVQLTVASLVEEFGSYGVTPDALEALETPEEMEALCLETKANALEARLAAGVTAAPTTVQPATPAVVETPPAGATRTSDVGGGGGAPHQPAQLSAEPGRENLAANIAATGWSTVKLPY